jgi:predicted flap endonuclease-1-like 5' DNA nuclease
MAGAQGAPGAASSDGAGDDLTAIRGIGPALQDQLRARGIATYADIAALSSEDQATLGDALGFTGRVEREDWVAQARELMDSPAASARPTGGRETRLGVLANAGRALGSLDDSDKAEALSEDEAAAMRLIESGDFVADDSNRPTVLMDAAPAGGGDDLKVIKGVGPKLEGLLNGLGVYQFSQIAAFSATDIAWVDSKLSFKGRIVRDRWVDQARDLAG